jgi:hypothetical protein
MKKSELNQFIKEEVSKAMAEAVDTGAFRRLVITSPKYKLIQSGAEKYLAQNAHMYPDLTFKVMPSPKPNTFVIDLVGNKATVVGIKLQDLAERLDNTAIVLVRKEKKLGVKESIITEDVSMAFLILAQAAIVQGLLIGQMANSGGGDGFHPIDDLKAWWQKRKSDKALKSIIDKIKGDEDVVKFMKLTPSQQRGKFRSLIATKLNDEELEYLSKINKSHFQTESIITEAEAPLYKDWNEFVNPDSIMVHLKDGRKLQINKKNVAGGQRVYQAILQAFSDERTDITNKVVAAMASMLGGTLNKESMNEGSMSDIDLMAQEAKDFNSFVKEFMKEYSIDSGSTTKLKDWLQSIYNDAKSTTESVITEATTKTILGVKFKMAPAPGNGIKFEFVDAKQFIKSGISANEMVEEIQKMLDDKFGKDLFWFKPAGRMQYDTKVNGFEFRMNANQFFKDL